MLKRFKKAFGNNFYIEIQRHNDPGEKIFEKFLLKTAKELNTKINAMKKYKNELRKFPHPRSLENIENSAKRWGTICDFHAAEAFEIIRKIQM